MSDDPTHLTTEQRRAMLAGVRVPNEDDGAIYVPHEYVAEIAGHLMQELNARHITKRVTVSANREAPEVAITMERPIAGYFQQITDCLEAWQQHLDPKQVARQAAARFEENLSRATRGG
jgi:hypothetical protein